MNDKWVLDVNGIKQNIVPTSTNHRTQYEEADLETYCNNLRQKTVVIIGGSVSAQELQITHFFMAGANVYFLITDISEGHRLARQINDDDKRNHIRPVNCDVANQSQLKQRLEAINKLTGSIDVLINNIVASDLDGRNESGGIDSQAVDYLQTTLSSAANVYPFMMTKNAGTIINVHATMLQRGISRDTHCASIKGELAGVTSGLASKMSGDNITVNSILLCLGKTDEGDFTDGMDALNEIQSVYDIARLSVFLASDACSTMTGQVLLVSNHQ